MRPSRDTDAWFRQPVVWLGAAVLAASLVACVVTIVLASRHGDAPIDTGERSVMTIPLRAHAATPPPAPTSR